VDGHLRIKAARKLRMIEVPVLLCDQRSPTQMKAFRLMANRSLLGRPGMTSCSRWSYRS
jgi:hypothetical protein